MNIVEAISTRRSIRSFTDAQVPMYLVRDLITVASLAPSAGDARPWQFIVIDDPELMAAMAEINRHGGAARNAPLGILVAGDLDRELIPGFWSQDCAAVTQNLLLLAHNSGLGATWTGLYPVRKRVRETRDILGLPDRVVPFSFVVLGYPARRPTYEKLSPTVDIHYNRWSDRETFADAARASATSLERITRS